MKIGFLITARLKSQRLPRKVLKTLGGRRVIDRVIRRCQSVRGCDPVVLCTSDLHDDLELVEAARDNGIYYYNGHPEDVLARLLTAAKLYGLDFFLAMTADNPIFSDRHATELIDRVTKAPEIDFITTVGMPIGVNVYAVKTKALETICAIKEEIDTEIWGPLIDRPEIFNIEKVQADEKYRCDAFKRLTLDEPLDYELFTRIYSPLDGEREPELLQVLRYLNSHPELSEINKTVEQRSLDVRVVERIDSFYRNNKQKIMQLKSEIYSC